MMHLLFNLLFIIFSFAVAFPIYGQYVEVRGLIDLRSTFSDGDHSIDELARLARSRGFDAIFINDHDRLVMEYGFPPFRHILKKSYELNSINKNGAENFLKAIERAQGRNPEVIIIPGAETAPFYYWSGTPWGKGLTAHNHERRLLVIGLTKPEDYASLPILHNKLPISQVNLRSPSLFYLLAMIMSLTLLFWPGRTRIMGFILFALSFLFFWNSDPLRASPFDPYSGDQGEAPYNLVIRYVNDRGGLIFWNYPETRSGVRRLGPISLETKPYPEMLLKTKGYTGFAALYGENITVTEPGSIWDMTLLEYCSGQRTWPPWAIATADYHGEGKDGARLGDYPTVFWVKEKSREDILKAMQTGKMYACATSYPTRIHLDEFSVSPPEGEKKAISGDEILMKGHPRIKIVLSVSGTEKAGPVRVRLIRSGQLIATSEGNLPLTIEYEDPYYRPGEKIFYRFDMKGNVGQVISNPIFVTFAR
ncbi:MAG: hypothetical protein N2572_07735 [Syntrophales bacterium]|nr:hypothetical protein [Syntrophales bacterium]